MHNLFITEDFKIPIFSLTIIKHSLHFHLTSLKREMGSVFVTGKNEGKRLKLDGGILS